MTAADALERLREHVMVCEGCGSTTTLAEILAKHPNAMTFCPNMRSKRKTILAQLAELQFTVSGKSKGLHR